MDETLKTFVIILGIISVIGGFIYWHFKTLHSFKDQVTDLKLQMKDLENKDNLQQQTLDQLKDLFPILKQAIEYINKDKK